MKTTEKVVRKTIDSEKCFSVQRELEANQHLVQNEGYE